MPHLYTYVREDEKQRILVVCSFTAKKTVLKAPKGFDLTAAELILQNYPDAVSTVLRPYEVRVYLWKK